MLLRRILLFLGIVLLVAGGLGIVAGLAVAVLGPAFVEDAAEGAREAADRGDGRRPTAEEIAEAKLEARILGVEVGVLAALVAFAGGVLYALARATMPASPPGA